MKSATPLQRGAELRHDSAEDKGRATAAEEQGVQSFGHSKLVSQMDDTLQQSEIRLTQFHSSLPALIQNSSSTIPQLLTKPWYDADLLTENFCLPTSDMLETIRLIN
jgi:hypothetical protein